MLGMTCTWYDGVMYVMHIHCSKKQWQWQISMPKKVMLNIYPDMDWVLC